MVSQLGPLVEKLRLPDPAEMVQVVMDMSPEDAAELQSRWMMPKATGPPKGQPVWRPPTLQHLPQTHQVTMLLATRIPSETEQPLRTVRLRNHAEHGLAALGGQDGGGLKSQS